MDDISTTTSALEGVDKAALVTRIIKNSTQLLEDYVLWNKCGWSDEEFGGLLGISPKTVKNRYLADARKQGLIEAGKRGQASPVYARSRAKPVENSTTNHLSPQTDDSFQHVSATVPNTVTVSVSEPYVDSYSDGCDETTVSMGTSDQRAGDELHAEIISRIDSIYAIFRDNFLPEESPLTEDHWRSISQECDTLKDFADVRWSRQRSNMDRANEETQRRLRDAIGASRSKSLGEST